MESYVDFIGQHFDANFLESRIENLAVQFYV